MPLGLSNVTENQTMEKNIVKRILEQQRLEFMEYYENYLRKAPEIETRNEEDGLDAKYTTFASWFRRGMKSRWFLNLLGILGHTMVIVPIGSKVTVETARGRKATFDKTPEVSNVVVFSSDDDGRSIVAESVSTVDIILRKRRSPKD